jgi:F-type H+-transporting ATPase subunit a
MLSLLVALTRLLNHLFAAPVMGLLTHLGVHVDNPAAPISRTLTLELIVLVVFLLFFVAVRATLSAERPGAGQLWPNPSTTLFATRQKRLWDTATSPI